MLRNDPQNLGFPKNTAWMDGPKTMGLARESGGMFVYYAGSHSERYLF